MSTSMVLTSSSSMANINNYSSLDAAQRARLVNLNSNTKSGHMLGRSPSLLSTRADSPRPRGPRNPSPQQNRFGDASATRRVLTKDPSGPQTRKPLVKQVRRQGSVFGMPSSQNLYFESSSSTNTNTSSRTAPASPSHSRTSSESLPEFRSFSANRKRKTDAPAPLMLGRSNGSTQEPTLLVIPSSQTGRSRRPSTSPSSSKALGLRGREGKASATATSERLRSISNSLAPPVPDSGLLGLFAGGKTGHVSADDSSTPLTPSFRHIAPTIPAVRQQKLQKLSRTLGENIPASLIFPEWNNERLQRPQRSPSVGGMFPRSPTSPAHAARLADELTTTSSSKAASKAKKGLRRRSASVGNLFDLALDINFDELEEVRGKNAKGESQWRPPNEWSDGPSENRHPEPTPKPREQTQPGTWNAPDYGLVMDKLRNLRR